MLQEITRTATKVYFKHFRVATMSDGIYRFEHYPHSFTSIIEAITWGRAYEAALEAHSKAQSDLNNLLNQVGAN